MVARYKKWQPPSSHVHEPGGQTDGKCSVILFSQTTKTRGLRYVMFTVFFDFLTVYPSMMSI